MKTGSCLRCREEKKEIIVRGDYFSEGFCHECLAEIEKLEEQYSDVLLALEARTRYWMDQVDKNQWQEDIDKADAMRMQEAGFTGWLRRWSKTMPPPFDPFSSEWRTELAKFAVTQLTST